MEIGKGNRIPWHLPGDLKHFKETTMGYPLIMGRKTFESMDRALPGRKTVILTGNKDYTAEGATVVGSMKEALELYRDSDKVFIAGGGEIFRQAMPIADTIILTTLNREEEGDVFFPEIPSGDFVEVGEKIIENQEDEETYSVKLYRRKNSAAAQDYP